MPANVLGRFFGGSDRYGDYQIIDEISEGGMSHVYRARRVSDGEVIALKILKTGMLPNPEKVERAARRTEGEIATGLYHENIVRTYEFGKRGEEHFIVMEYIDGPKLGELIRAGEVAEEDKMRYIMEIGRAIEHLHSKGIVHRDVCPKNVLVTPEGKAKLIDFGLAILESERIPHLWERSGTASYMAPEQIRGNQGDHRADIYAFGVTIYEILTGRRPFEGDNRLTRMQGHLNIEAPPPSQFNDKISAELDELILAALAKNPGHRPRSMQAFMNMLSLLQRQKVLQAEDPVEDTVPVVQGKHGRHWERGEIHRALGKAGLELDGLEQ